MARPVIDAPRWATGAALIVEPGSGKKDVGWITNEAPPASYFNWFFNAAYMWLNYAKNALGANEGDWALDNNLTVATTAPIKVTSSADGDATSGNEWKLVLQFQAGTNRRIHFYTGKTGQQEAFILCNNAVWAPASHNFSQINAALDSFAVVLSNGDIYFSKVTAGASAWSSWPGATARTSIQGGNVVVGGTIQATGTITGSSVFGTTALGAPTVIASIAVQGQDLISVGDTTAGGDLVSQNDVRAADNFTYSIARTVRGQVHGSEMKPFVASGLSPTIPSDDNSGDQLGDNTAVRTCIAFLDIPDGATLTSVQVQVTGVTPGSTSFQVVRQNQTDWSAGPSAPPTVTSIGSGPFVTLSSGLETISSAGISQVINTGTMRIQVRIALQQNSLPCRAHAIRYTYTQPRL